MKNPKPCLFISPVCSIHAQHINYAITFLRPFPLNVGAWGPVFSISRAPGPLCYAQLNAPFLNRFSKLILHWCIRLVDWLATNLTPLISRVYVWKPRCSFLLATPINSKSVSSYSINPFPFILTEMIITCSNIIQYMHMDESCLCVCMGETRAPIRM